jgi:hypothetical protein
MVSKHSAVRSIRLPNSEWEWLIEEAARREVTVNGLVQDLLMVGRLRAEEARAAPVRRPAQKVAPKPVVAKAESPLKRPPVPYGSRLKKR